MKKLFFFLAVSLTLFSAIPTTSFSQCAIGETVQEYNYPTVFVSMYVLNDSGLCQLNTEGLIGTLEYNLIPDSDSIAFNHQFSVTPSCSSGIFNNFRLLKSNCDLVTPSSTHTYTGLDYGEIYTYKIDWSLSGGEECKDLETACVWYTTGTKYDHLSTEFDIEKPKINIYPNPTSDYVNISGVPETSNLSLYNISGNEVWHSPKLQHNSSPYSIDLSSYPKGVYFLQLYSDTESQTNKIVLM